MPEQINSQKSIMEIPLRQDYNLVLERSDKKIRLVIFHKGIEIGCRKEKLTDLQKFIAADDGILFKGRLQLNKKGNEILVIFKNQTLGNIYYREFESVLKRIDLTENVF